MYLILLRLKKFYEREFWLKMVDNAKEAGKISEEEYKLLVSEENENQ